MRENYTNLFIVNKNYNCVQKEKNYSSILFPDHHGHFNQLGTMASDGADPYLCHYKEKVTAGGHCSVKD